MDRISLLDRSRIGEWFSDDEGKRIQDLARWRDRISTNKAVGLEIVINSKEGPSSRKCYAELI